VQQAKLAARRNLTEAKRRMETTRRLMREYDSDVIGRWYVCLLHCKATSGGADASAGR